MTTTEEYEEKQQAKADACRKKAGELKAESEEFFSKGFCERTGLPLGQPILVGHHSEKRHRNAIKKYEGQMQKHIDGSDQARRESYQVYVLQWP